jgi:hypothetical protein
MLNRAEKAYHTDLGSYSERKKTAIHRLQSMDPALRDREHRFCMKIWSTVVGERDNRRYLEQISTTSEHLKKALEISYQHVHYSGQGQMRYYNGFVMKLWKQVHIRLSGSTLRLGHENCTKGPQDSDFNDFSGGDDQSKRKASMNGDNSNESQAKSRTIMIESISSVEISLKLPLFPRVQQALVGRRHSTSSAVDTSSVTPQDQASKVYFIFHFKNSSNSRDRDRDCAIHSSSPYLQKQREKSQTPPKHPIVLSVNATSPLLDDDHDATGAGAGTGPLALLEAIRAAMPDVEVTGASCLLAAEPNNCAQVSVSARASADGSYNETHPLVRSSESQVHSPSDWGQLGSGRTSVESLLTANSSVDSHRTRSSHSSSQRRSTLSSMDESVSEHDQQQMEASEGRKRPCVLGSVIEERESRHSNDSHSSHSRNNSNSVMSGGRFPFSNDVILEHSRYIHQESAMDDTSVRTSHSHSQSHSQSRGSEESSQVSSGLVEKSSPKRRVEKNGLPLSRCC